MHRAAVRWDALACLGFWGYRAEQSPLANKPSGHERGGWDAWWTGWSQERTRKDGEGFKRGSQKDGKEREEAQEETRWARREMPQVSQKREWGIGRKPVEDVFKDTGMDPEPSRRARVLKRARRIGKKRKKKDKGSSSSSDSSRSSLTDYGNESSEEEKKLRAIFEEEKKLRAIWLRCQGCRHLYNREASPSAICQGLDLLVQGCVASCMDLLNQRLKSLEALGKGAHWPLRMQYELVKVKEGGMTEETEKLGAARRAREEERMRSLMMRPQGTKGG